jgi:hypothetical protein
MPIVGYSKYARSSFGESVVAWDGLILNGWAQQTYTGEVKTTAGFPDRD